MEFQKPGKICVEDHGVSKARENLQGRPWSFKSSGKFAWKTIEFQKPGKFAGKTIEFQKLGKICVEDHGVLKARENLWGRPWSS